MTTFDRDLLGVAAGERDGDAASRERTVSIEALDRCDARPKARGLGGVMSL